MAVVFDSTNPVHPITPLASWFPITILVTCTQKHKLVRGLKSRAVGRGAMRGGLSANANLGPGALAKLLDWAIVARVASACRRIRRAIQVGCHWVQHNLQRPEQGHPSTQPPRFVRSRREGRAMLLVRGQADVSPFEPLDGKVCVNLDAQSPGKKGQ